MTGGDLVTELEASRRLAVSVKTLRRWRWARREVPFVKCGNAVRYSTEDIAAYIAKRKQEVQQ